MNIIKSNHYWSDGDIKLIEKVKQYPNLYTDISKARWQSEENFKIWDDISKELGWSACKCRRRWSLIKRSYVQKKQRGQRNSKFMDGTLRFLDLAAKAPKNSSTPANLRKKTLENETRNKPNSLVVDQNMVQAVLEAKKKIGERESTIDEAVYQSVSKLLSQSSLQPILDPSKNYAKLHENSLISLPSSSTQEALSTSNTRENIYDNSMFKEEHSSSLLKTEDSPLVTKQIDALKNSNDVFNLELTIMTNLANAKRDPNDMKTFFRSISEYSSAKLSLAQQKDLRLKIHALMCKEELDFWTENIKEEDLDF